MSPASERSGIHSRGASGGSGGCAASTPQLNEDRRWVPMNDVSAWYKSRRKAGRVIKTKFHIR